MNEEETLRRYSTPSLQRGELTRFAKREQLSGNGIRGEEAKKILDELYGPEEETS